MKQRDINPFGLRMPPKVKEWIEQKSADQERSQNWLIVKILEQEMVKDERSSETATA